MELGGNLKRFLATAYFHKIVIRILYYYIIIPCLIQSLYHAHILNNNEQ